MRRLSADDLKEMNLFKHWRIIRKWACRNNNLNDADIELLIYLDCMDMFTKKDFEAVAIPIVGITAGGIDCLRKVGLWCGESVIEQRRSITYTKHRLNANIL